VSWTDYRGYPIPVGAIVLDDQGNCWVTTNRGGYGQENIAQCDGIGYNIKVGVAVRLGLTFKIAEHADAKYCPDSQRIGAEMYNRQFVRDVEPQLTAKLKARRWKGRGR